jgi:23S rRNA (cytidine1920-2'-O)/16S rRNA (cytidine1409-2'-O)-methyltransferase
LEFLHRTADHCGQDFIIIKFSRAKVNWEKRRMGVSKIEIRFPFTGGRLYSFLLMAQQKKKKMRVDELVVTRGLAESPAMARAMILAGEVLVNEQKVEKCGALVDAGASMRQLSKHSKFVSRAGIKLEQALNHFHIDPARKVCLDVGASTGGFTDCLLQHGAARVLAVDAGTNQLDWKIRHDPRVVPLEKTNARYLTLETLGTRVRIATMDVSFISATMVVPVLPGLLEIPAEVLVLVKPQFEVRREQVEPGGLVSDPRLHQWAISKVSRKLEELGFGGLASVQSALPGAEGNLEYFLHAVWTKRE